MTTRSSDTASAAVPSRLPSSTRMIVSTTPGGILASVVSSVLAALYAGMTTTVRNDLIEPLPVLMTHALLLSRVWQLRPSLAARTNAVLARLTSFRDGSYRIEIPPQQGWRPRARVAATGRSCHVLHRITTLRRVSRQPAGSCAGRTPRTHRTSAAATTPRAPRTRRPSLHSSLEAERRLPAEPRQTRRIDRIPTIVSEPVADELLEGGGLAEQAQNGVGNGDPVGLSAGADVVVETRLTVPECGVDTAHMVVDVEVVANRAAIAVDRQRAVIDRVGDEQRDDLLRDIETVRMCWSRASRSRGTRTSCGTPGPGAHLPPCSRCTGSADGADRPRRSFRWLHRRTPHRCSPAESAGAPCSRAASMSTKIP